MAQHKVYFDLPTRELGKSDVHFVVKKDGVVFGKLEVSRGALVWYPKNARRGRKIGWQRLHDMAMERRKSEWRSLARRRFDLLPNTSLERSREP